jgi:hypothetical protein
MKKITTRVKTSIQFVVTSVGVGGNPGTMKSNGISIEVAEHKELSSTMSAEEAGRLGLIKCDIVGVCKDGSNFLMVWLKESPNARLMIYNIDKDNWKIIAAELPELVKSGKQDAGIFMSGEVPKKRGEPSKPR